MKQKDPVRALILMGPRRVGKTTILHQVVANLIDDGVPADHVMYVAIDAPIYTGMSLEQLVAMFLEMQEHKVDEELTIIFDEIQYLKNWEVHLKSLVDTYPMMKFVVSGSAAAALKLASNESGAGRFTDFFLPPLTFAEYVDFINLDVENTRDIATLNKHFIDYLNYGGYPEAVFSKEIQSNPSVFIKNDIIDKVLLRDLPSLYGISDIQELNKLFAVLAYNTGQEVSIQKIASDSGVAKNTIIKYIRYLEAAFLLFRVNRIDRDARSYKRVAQFKIYLTNPSMKAALFDKVDPNTAEIGAMVETAVFSQWLHSRDFNNLYYVRFGNDKPEVDVAYKRTGTSKPQMCIEIKWSDKSIADHGRIKGILDFCDRHKMEKCYVTTETVRDTKTIGGTVVEFVPTSSLALAIGRNILKNLSLEDTNRLGSVLIE